jgi:hypothetical protein
LRRRDGCYKEGHIVVLATEFIRATAR